MFPHLRQLAPTRMKPFPCPQLVQLLKELQERSWMQLLFTKLARLKQERQTDGSLSLQVAQGMRQSRTQVPAELG